MIFFLSLKNFPDARRSINVENEVFERRIEIEHRAYVVIHSSPSPSSYTYEEIKRQSIGMCLFKKTHPCLSLSFSLSKKRFSKTSVRGFLADTLKFAAHCDAQRKGRRKSLTWQK